MADLVRGSYPVTSFLKKLGLPVNSSQANEMCRTNMEYFGLGNPSDGALAATGVSVSVPVPVEMGDIISRVTILVGATAEAAGTHAFMALYSGIGTPALLAQSADDTGATSAAASAPYSRALQSQIQITPTNAPNGFVYATICFTATVPTALSVAIPTAVGYQWFTSSTTPAGNSPLFLSATHGSAQGATAAATIATPSAKAVAPIVFLT